jgi:hypothetical protein
VIRCEFQFENFNARGDDEYLNEFARRLDDLFQAGWTALDTSRDPAFHGWWQLCLLKEGGLDVAKARSRS